MLRTIKQSALAFSALALTVPALAGDDYIGEKPSTVVELFTSQGCSSCPPANEFVGTLIEDHDKLVLSYGVTYWDYLGWQDTFGDPAFTLRQKAYGAALDIGFVYTPQIVLNGETHDSRFTRNDVKETNPIDKNTEIDLTEMNGQLYLASNADQLVLVTYTPGWQEVAVKRGENHGRTLKIANVVDDVRIVEPSKPLNIQIEAGKAYAALLHDQSNMNIIGASVLKPQKK